jgi:mono/diheme cytochrome c family protein
MSLAKHVTAVPIAAGLVILMSLLVVTGCRKNDASSSLPAAQGNSAADFGRKVFAASGCVRCHTVGGQGGHVGPDLTHVGADPSHTLDWFMQRVSNPRAWNPSSRMPAFQGNSRDLVALAGYLAGLK